MWTGVSGWWWRVNKGSCFVSGRQSWTSHVVRNSSFSRETKKWGFCIHSLDCNMFATKLDFFYYDVVGYWMRFFPLMYTYVHVCFSCTRTQDIFSVIYFKWFWDSLIETFALNIKVLTFYEITSLVSKVFLFPGMTFALHNITDKNCLSVNSMYNSLLSR